MKLALTVSRQFRSAIEKRQQGGNAGRSSVSEFNGEKERIPRRSSGRARRKPCKYPHTRGCKTKTRPSKSPVCASLTRKIAGCRAGYRRRCAGRNHDYYGAAGVLLSHARRTGQYVFLTKEWKSRSVVVMLRNTRAGVYREAHFCARDEKQVKKKKGKKERKKREQDAPCDSRLA